MPVRRNAADAREGGEVHLYRDSSAAPLLDLRRRLKAVMDVLDVMIRDGFSFARSVELAVQWDGILGEGPIGPVTREDCQGCWEGGGGERRGGVGESRRLVGDLHCWLSDSIHRVVVHRRDVAFTAWRNWLREDPLVHTFYKWLRPDLVPPAPLLQCQPLLTPGHSGVLADPAGICEEFRKSLGFPLFVVLGKGRPVFEEFNDEVDGWLPLLPEASLPELTGEMLADVARRNGATVGSLDGWGWRELKVLPVPWCDGLARVLSKV